MFSEGSGDEIEAWRSLRYPWLDLPSVYGDFIDFPGLSADEAEHFVELLANRLFGQQRLDTKWIVASESKRVTPGQLSRQVRDESPARIKRFLQNQEVGRQRLPKESGAAFVDF